MTLSCSKRLDNVEQFISLLHEQYAPWLCSLDTSETHLGMYLHVLYKVPI